MRAYIDASAFVKLVVLEPETTALKSWLDAQTPEFRLMSSLLLEAEARRAAQIRGATQAVVTSALTQVSLAEAPRAVFTQAGTVMPPLVRTLDALHLATALRHSADVLICYDSRLASAAHIHGIPVVAPT